MALAFNLMRSIDRNAGAFALVAMRPVWWMLDRLRPRPTQSKVLLVQKYLGIGSIINAIPLLRLLRAAHPDGRIIFLTFPEQAPLVSLTGLADEVLVVDSRSIPRFVFSLGRALARLWRAKVDTSIDLEFFSRFSMMVACLSGARLRIGFFAYFHVRSPLLTHPVSLNHYRHVSRAFLAMAEAMGFPVEAEDLRPHLPSYRAESIEALRTVFPDFGTRPYVVINSNTSQLCTLRAWGPARFAEVIRRLGIERPDLALVLIGTKAERPLAEMVLAQAGETKGQQVLNLAGQTSLVGMLALLEGAELLISNDSGPAHIAAAYGIPEVVLFGPETPVLYGPLNDRARVVYRPPYCSPCLHAIDNKHFEDCSPAVCMDSISVDDVMAEVRALLPAMRGQAGA
jgi:ADP-heptose:LPS heptosyltransferase